MVSRRETLDAASYSRMLAFIQEGNSVARLDELPRFITTTLPCVVPCISVSYNEVDPPRQRIVSHLHPDTGRFPADAELLGSLMNQHPLISYYRRTRDGRALKISDFLSDEEFRALDIYRLVYSRLDTNYQMAVTLPAPQPLIIGIALNRKDHDFSEVDRLKLNLLRPHLEYMHHRLESQAQAARTLDTLREALDAAGHGMLAVDQSGVIGEANAQAVRLLERFANEAPRHGSRPPTDLSRWLDEQRRGLVGTIDGSVPSEPLILRGTDGRLVCRYLPAVRPGDLDVVVLVPELPRDTPRLASYGLTPREAEILAMVAGGKTNAAIARDLVISERTVQKHLEHVFRKLRVSNRTGAAARMIEASEPNPDGTHAGQPSLARLRGRR